MSNFIKARLNKDNFWNLVVFLFLLIGFASIGLLTIALAVFCRKFLVKTSGITFDKENKHFLIRENVPLKTSGAAFVFLMFCSFGITALVGLICDNLHLKTAGFAIVLITTFLVPTLYCIIRNIPIAVFFTKEAWIGKITGINHESPDHIYTTSSHSSLHNRTPFALDDILKLS